jgi:L-seryl-tRNA(Ser) seleniumtransferase
MTSRYRGLPSVDKVLAHPTVAELMEHYLHDIVTDAVREALQTARVAVAGGGDPPTVDQLAEAVLVRGLRQWGPWPVPVINATGVILHTNLGRAPLSDASIQAASAVAAGYSNLEMDLQEGHRNSRHEAVASLLCQLTGAEDALAVNNNAGAVLLGLAALGAGRDVIVSRGEAVEIGGGFRIPDVLRQSGARLVEVGTVNRTYAHDYAQAITDQTAAILVVHRSNFQVVGFTHDATLQELAQIAHERDVPLLHDLGSGALLDTAVFGLAHEPTPQESVAVGVDLVFFSGDKLLGGPQAGLVAGKQELVQRLARHPLTRALRTDKLTLAALHATLLHYLKGEAERQIPIWRMVVASADGIAARAHSWAKGLGKGVKVVRGQSTLGGGSMPGELLETWLLSIAPTAISGGAEVLARALRMGTPPIMARIDQDRVVLDPRTVLPAQDPSLMAALKSHLEH